MFHPLLLRWRQIIANFDSEEANFISDYNALDF
jgi:hypothetical protein